MRGKDDLIYGFDEFILLLSLHALNSQQLVNQISGLASEQIFSTGLLLTMNNVEEQASSFFIGICIGYFQALLGFSWDSVANDYKLLAISSGRSSSCTHSNGLVYSSRTNCWSNIADPPVVYGLKVPSVIVKGIPYWKCSAILKFEVRNNEFNCFTVSKDVGKHNNLANLNDCLARIEFAGKTDSMVGVRCSQLISRRTLFYHAPRV
ncbi:hypothetical protein POM88_024530 [Heracleum sosnowskyi]|uniref:Uncharacterized protein n=1 Tax=Heracleum sosnowskyi TaxID=360622 RepID=A0AAD8I384_9APIA|nr:hypothetical protein POM88_024530 [Heracleum sosnowskyi]